MISLLISFQHLVVHDSLTPVVRSSLTSEILALWIAIAVATSAFKRTKVWAADVYILYSRLLVNNLLLKGVEAGLDHMRGV